MKKILVATLMIATLLSGCKSNKTEEVQPVSEPSWFQNKTYFDEKNGMYEEMPIYSENIVMVGDDFIDRGIWSEMYGDTTIKNRGITYDGIEHVLYRIDNIAKAKPAKIIVSAGFNDIFFHNTSVDSVVLMTREVFDHCKKLSPSTELYYANIVLVLDDSEKVARMKEVNEKVKAMADECGFGYIDIDAALQKGIKNGKYSYDGGVYLNGAGYEALATALEKAVGRTHLNKAADVKDKKEVTDYYKHRVSMFRSLPRSEGKIVMLGNSLNNNALWTELFPFTPIVNRGISGDIISGIDQRLDEIVSLKPAKIFLQSGCNDMYNKEEIDITKVWADYETLIKDIKKKMPNTDLYVQSLFHLGRDAKYPEVFNKAADEINKLLEAGVEKYEYFYLDINSLLVDEEGYLKPQYTFDSIHLSAEGYFVWATELCAGNRMIIM